MRVAAITSDHRRFLARELENRMERNPSYSARAFAKALGLSHAYLSLILSGQRPLPGKLRERLAPHLQLTPVELSHWLDDPMNKNTGTDQTMDLDVFALISEWQHYAILSLLEIKKCDLSPRGIAKRLGISVLLAKTSFARLERLGFIVRGKNGTFAQGRPAIRIENRVSTLTTRKFHRQLLRKAVESLEKDPVETRDFSSITFAMDPATLPFAVEEIRKFRRALCAQLEKIGPAKEVYNLTVQLYPVSRSPSGKSERE